jgi:Clp amino terminal domain, pathogenicity island component
MFEKFNDGARRATVLAVESARELGHEYVGPEHILLGIAQEGRGIGAVVLASSGISEDRIRRQIEEAAGRSSHLPAGHIPFTGGSKDALVLAVRESLRLGHDYIGTEHLLMGIAGDSGGLAVQILAGSGADVARIHELVMCELASLTITAATGAPPEVPVDQESPEEAALFSTALSLAMGAPEIVRAATGIKADAIQAHMLRLRGQMWSAVAEQRSQMRTAAAERKSIEGKVMPRAEAAARAEHPECLELFDEAAAQEKQIQARVAQCGALVKKMREASDQKLTSEAAQYADQVTAETVDTLQQGDAWLKRVRLERQQPNSSGSESGPHGAVQRPRLRAVQARLRQVTAGSGRTTNARYVEGSNLLRRLREQSAEISTERKRAELQLSQFARQIANQNEAFSASTARLDAASNALTAALRHSLIPEILSFAYGAR